tara:strand:- start:13500 stop:14072 length:573 start_codon:yes stop_codon:yes gene_type:complete
MNFPQEHQLAIDWHVPLLSSNRTWLKTALREMEPFKLKPTDVPLIIRLIENPKYDIGIFPGAVSLLSHDCIHIILGRGVLPKDEAFVIGYTMGSTKKMTPFREKMFLLISKYLYPEGYNFGEEEAYVFKHGVIAGSRCLVDLTKVDFRFFSTWELKDIRRKFGISVDFLKLCYILEQKKFPNSPESKRLL